VVLWGEHEEDTQVAKKGHTEEQILRAMRQAEGGTRVADICREHGISEATIYIYGRLPRGKKVSGPGLAMIDCKHLFGVTTLWCAQMGNPLTLASTSGRPRGPL
jgi:putative transposase